MLIRAAKPEDAEAIAQVHVQAWQETYPGLIPYSYLAQLDVQAKHAIWVKVLSLASPVFVLEAKGEVVGFASGGRNRKKDSPYLGELYTIHILKAFQGYKMGRTLFEAVQDSLTQRGLLPFVTHVLKGNNALGFYQHLGGKVTGERMEDFDGLMLQELQVLWEI